MRLTMLLDMAVDGFGDRVLVGRRTDGFTAKELRDRARAGATAIRAADADAVLYLAVNGPAFPVAMFAAAYAGVPLVPVNYRLGHDQLQALLAKHPRAVGIADDAGLAHLDAAGITGMTPDAWLVATGGEAGELDELWDAEDTAVVIYTSGTTSEPKGVLLRHGNLVSYVLGSVEFMNADPADAALVSVPPYHIAAVANVISNLYAGRRTIVLEQFRPEQWLETVREEAVTNALVVPTMLQRIIECVDHGGADGAMPSLRGLAYGGAPMPGAVIERALRHWPQVGFVNAYGLTETSSTVAVLGPDEHRAALGSDDPVVRARLSSVGRVLPGIELEIRDEDDQVLPPGVPGRICVRGEQVSAEYAGIGRAVDDRGFFDTRDKGFVDVDGFLFIGGRIDDTIIRGAENIAPAEIEEVILRHPAVLDVAVVGVPDEEWGQRIEAAVVTRSDSDLDDAELRGFVQQALRSSKTPERFWFWPELPRTETGKLVRRHVLERVLSSESAPA
jgi:acyl-CoA synthetase (AMP-forming)/AMP-acid ligase II